MSIVLAHSLHKFYLFRYLNILYVNQTKKYKYLLFYQGKYDCEYDDATPSVNDPLCNSFHNKGQDKFI